MNQPARAVLDIQALQVDGFADRGIGRYVAAYASALARAGRVAATLLAPELPPAASLPGGLVAADLVRWDSVAEARRLLEEDPAGYHVTAPFLHSGPGDPAVLAVAPHWAESGLARIVTLYDLIPLRAPRHYLPTPAHEERYRRRAEWVAASELVLAISEHTRNEAIDLLGCDPDRVVTVGVGVSPFFSPPDGTDDQLWRFHFGPLEGRPHILTVTGSDVRKGTERLIAALGVLVGRGLDLSLIAIGDLTPVWCNQLEEAAGAAGVSERVVLAGPVSDELLRACYRRAAATVMPSLAEGAGLPVLESAACGTPALASATSALGEAAATPLATFDPTDPGAIADCIASLLEDSARRSQIIGAQAALAARSAWSDVAARAAAALDRLTSTAEPARRPTAPWPRRLALVGPVAPEGGGIGVYTQRLLAGLPEGIAADAVVTGTGVPELAPGVGYVAASAFGLDYRPASYDAVVYCLGNSAGHLPTVQLALRYPGWLWFHEVRLPAVAVTALADRDDEAFESAMEALLNRAYPGRAPVGAARKAGRSNLDLLGAGVGLIGPLVERCCGVLVNSQAARRLLLLDLVPGAYHPPVHVLPPACPDVRPRGLAGIDSRDPLVTAFGVVSMSKRPDLLVDAAALAGFRVAFVGPCPPILAEVIGDRARARGVTDRVTVVGAVDERDWLAWMDATAVAVQLRDTDTGETSAAILESLAAGIPVVTNLHSAAEYPSGTVSLVSDCSPEAVADRVTALLQSPEERRDLTESAQVFAAEHGFKRLAAELLAVVTG